VKLLAVVLGVLAVIAAIVAIVYYTVPAHSLPSVLGAVHCKVGHQACLKVHRVNRGKAAAVGAVLLAVIAGVVYLVARRAEQGGTSVGKRLMGT